jgi:replicative DNA helicase
MDSLENRIARRRLASKVKRPFILIDEFDQRTKGPGRGDLGLLIALYKMGKSLMLAYLATAYALQKLNVLYFTLEDPVDEVEDRMDASMANMPIDKLNALPNKLRKRFRKFSAKVSGHIRIVDATEEGISVEQIEETWEHLRDQGFTADVIIIDYDDEIVPPRKQTDRRHEFADIYRALRKLAAKTNTIMWTAAQTKRIGEKTKVITGNQLAEDISKIRKATVAIGIGQGEEHPDARYLFVAAHKRGRGKFGFSLMSSPDKGLFFDRERTSRLIWNGKKGIGRERKNAQETK